MDQPEEKVITLRHPLTLGKGPDALTYTELKLREPRGGELEKATREDTNVGVSLTLISLISGIPRRAVEDIAQRDLREASDYLGGFTDDGPPTGPTPSPT
jgi:Phage tail assembly chaperone proteins, E, or 41 or 14